MLSLSLSLSLSLKTSFGFVSDIHMQQGPEKSEMASYPPPFRHSFEALEGHPNQEEEEEEEVEEEEKEEAMDDDVPVIDLRSPDDQALGQACKEWGVFRLINHGIPEGLSNRVWSHAMDLLSLPFESKQTQFTHPITYFWGTPALQQSVHNLNWVEGFHAPLAKVALQHQLGSRLDQKQAMIESFRCELEEYGHHMARIGRTVFDILAKNLGLDPAQKASYLAESDGLLRIYRYPCYLQNQQVVGMDAHTDSSVLSILNQDEVGGLQLFRNKKWVDVKPIPRTLIINLGDMMQAMSSDEYKSVKHRVAVNVTRDRMSICYFAFPKEDGVILSSNYKSFSYKEFQAQVQEDIKETGFKVGLDRFRKISLNGSDAQVETRADAI